MNTNTSNEEKKINNNKPPLNTSSIINEESKKGSQFSILDNEEKQVKIQQVNREIEIQKKELELQKEIEKSLKIKQQNRKNIEKKVVLIASLLVVFATAYWLSSNFIRKPFEYKYSLLYLYDMTNIAIKQQTTSHNSYITFMTLAEKNEEDLQEVAYSLYYDLNIDTIYESNKETIYLISTNLPDVKGMSTKYNELHNYTIEYFAAINELNELLLEIVNIDFDEYKAEYLERVKVVNVSSQKLFSLLNETNLLGF